MDNLKEESITQEMTALHVEIMTALDFIVANPTDANHVRFYAKRCNENVDKFCKLQYEQIAIIKANQFVTELFDFHCDESVVNE